MKWQKISEKIRELWNAGVLSSEERSVFESLSSRIRRGQSRRPWLIQAMPDAAYLMRLDLLCEALGEEGPSSIHWTEPLIPYRHNRPFKDHVFHTLLKLPLELRKWRKLFGTWTNSRVVIAQDEHAVGEWHREQALKIFNGLQSHEDLASLRLGDLWVGDLINDSYLRFQHAPTVDLRSRFLLEIIESALSLKQKYEDLFRENQYEIFVTSYTSYIEHGIAVRLALKQQIPVYTLLTGLQLVARATSEFPYHRRNFHLYRIWFNQLSTTERRRELELGHAGLRRRLSGQKDSATAYMQQSAYEKSNLAEISQSLPHKDRPTVLIMGHDFFDSPHIYGRMIYTDFYLWLRETLEVLSSTDVEILVKPHPNGLPGNERIFSELQSQFPKMRLLPARAPTLALFERGVDLLVTVYGTIAHEAAYRGVRVLCAGDNPHSEYSFCRTAVDREEYLSLLRNFTVVPVPPLESDEVAEFYSMHNYRFQTEPAAELPYSLEFSRLNQVLSAPPERRRSLGLALLESWRRVDRI